MKMDVAIEMNYGDKVTAGYIKTINCPVLPPKRTELIIDGAEFVVDDIYIDIDDQSIYIRLKDGFVGFDQYEDDLIWWKDNDWTKEY